MKKEGYSLVEILVVMGIFAMILGIALPRIREVQVQQSENNAIRMIAAQIRSAASYAGARRIRLTMENDNDNHTLKVLDETRNIPDSQFSVNVPAGLEIPEGTLLTFEASGQVSGQNTTPPAGLWPISPSTDDQSSTPVQINGTGRSFRIYISAIGDTMIK